MPLIALAGLFTRPAPELPGGFRQKLTQLTVSSLCCEVHLTQCNALSTVLTSGCFLGGTETSRKKKKMSISGLKNPARSPAGKMGEVSRKWLSNESVPVARESPSTWNLQILEGKEKQVLAWPDNQKLQLALNQPLAQAGTEAVRALLCGTLSAWNCLLSLRSGTLVLEKRGPSVPGPSSPALGKKM